MYRIILKDGDTLPLYENGTKKTAIAVKDNPGDEGEQICVKCICSKRELGHICCAFNCVVSGTHLEWKEE